MADPRQNLVQFDVKPCGDGGRERSLVQITNTVTKRKGVLDALDKLGNVGLIGDIGGGGIGAALRGFVEVSNVVRTGCGIPHSIIGATVEAGTNWVLDNLGISDATINALKNFHPERVNIAVGHAQNVFSQITSGHFTASQIPTVLTSFVEIEQYARGIYTPSNNDASSIVDICDASPFAIDVFTRAPKYKFSFLVGFKMHPAYSQLSNMVRGMGLVIKTATRPDIKFEMEEANYYNFRTNVITKTIPDEMKMTFYDDLTNNVTSFYTECLHALSPITNVNSKPFDELEISGMLATNNKNDPNHTASLGRLAGDSKQTLFESISIYHIFNYGSDVNIYTFYNPRITLLSLDDLDMADGNNLNEMTMSFKYDYLNVETKKVADIVSILESLQAEAQYPLEYLDTIGAAAVASRKNRTLITTSPDACNTLNYSSR
jgi:hypothetical protein